MNYNKFKTKTDQLPQQKGLIFSESPYGAERGTRTLTPINGNGLLRPTCLPFHHLGVTCILQHGS